MCMEIFQGCSQRAEQAMFITKEYKFQVSLYLSPSRLWKVALVTDCGLHLYIVEPLTMNCIGLQVQYQMW